MTVLMEFPHGVTFQENFGNRTLGKYLEANLGTNVPLTNATLYWQKFRLECNEFF
jgi:hypothetical protein